MNMEKVTYTETNAFDLDIKDIKENLPSELQLLPESDIFYGFDGRLFKAFNKNIICDNSNARLKYIPVDENHSIDLKKSGEPTPAMGWAYGLYIRGDNTVWCKVDWTETGKEKLQKKEYKYLSPVFELTQEKEIILIIRAALTNNPNLSLTALNSQNNNFIEGEKNKMDKELTRVLGISENASITDAINAVDAMKSKQVDLSAYTSITELNAEREKREKAEKALNELNAEMAEIKKTALEKEANSAVDEAVKSGKIAPATRDVYVDMCMESGGIEKFKKIMENTPKSTAFEETNFKKVDNNTSLNAEEIETAKALGYTKEEYIALKAKNNGDIKNGNN